MEEIPTKVISLTYRTLINNMPYKLGPLRAKWELTTGPMENIDWEAALMHPREVAIKQRLRLIQYKILHRTYFDRARLHNMGRADTPECLRCHTECGIFIHTLWECSQIKTYWVKILRELNNILEAQLELEDRYILLGIPTDVDLPRHKLTLANLGLVVAKRDIARYWGVHQLPTLKEWRACLDLYMIAEKITYKARGCPRKF